MKRYLYSDNFFKKTFGKKTIRLSLSSGLSCPNRDGKLSYEGCIFCGKAGSGEFAADKNLSIKKQIEEQIKFLSPKWKTDSYIAYFQNFTNTYADPSYLKKIFDQAIAYDGVKGLAIATRCDCLSPEIIELLKEYDKKTFLFLELGLQSVNENTINFINRGYSQKFFDEKVNILKNEGIRFLTHIIFGLPYENREDFLNTVNYVSKIHPFGVKFHSFYIQKDTKIYKEFLKKPFPLLTKDEYTDIICDALEILPKDIVIHRLTGDPKKDLLLAPKWTLDKAKVLSGIDHELKMRDLPLIKEEK